MGDLLIDGGPRGDRSLNLGSSRKSLGGGPLLKRSSRGNSRRGGDLVLGTKLSPALLYGGGLLDLLRNGGGERLRPRGGNGPLGAYES